MSQSINPGRFHYLDVSRGALMLLGIPYHAGLLFSYFSSWAISANNPSWLISYFSLTLNIFRMPAFFALAGFFSALMLQKRSRWLWLKQRSFRLLVPFFFGAITFNSLQIYITARYKFNHGEVRNTWDFFINQASNFGSQWVRHLWFLVTLYLLCILTVVFWKKIKNIGNIKFNQKNIYIAIIALITYKLIISITLSIWQKKIGSVGPLYFPISLMDNLPYFIAGIWAFQNKETKNLNWLISLKTALLISIFLFLYFLTYKSNTLPLLFAGIITKQILTIIMSMAFFFLMHKFFNKKYSIIDKLVKYSFSIYLIHQPIISAYSLIASDIKTPPIFSWLIICAICLVLSWLFAILVTKSKALNFMFNGIYDQQARQPRQATSNA